MKRTGALILVLLAGNARTDEVYPDPAAAATPDYYTETQDRVYLQNRDGGHGGSHGGGHGGGYHQPTYYPQQQDPLIPNLYPTAILGALGCMGMAYFKTVIDQSYNTSLFAFEKLHDTVDYRLAKLEEMMDEDSKSNKKLDFKTKILCKFANLFNNPTYEICNQGFDAGQVIGPTGGPTYGYQETDPAAVTQDGNSQGEDGNGGSSGGSVGSSGGDDQGQDNGDGPIIESPITRGGINDNDDFRSGPGSRF